MTSLGRKSSEIGPMRRYCPKSVILFTAKDSPSRFIGASCRVSVSVSALGEGAALGARAATVVGVGAFAPSHVLTFTQCRRLRRRRRPGWRDGQDVWDPRVGSHASRRCGVRWQRHRFASAVESSAHLRLDPTKPKSQSGVAGSAPKGREGRSRGPEPPEVGALTRKPRRGGRRRRPGLAFALSGLPALGASRSGGWRPRLRAFAP